MKSFSFLLGFLLSLAGLGQECFASTPLLRISDGLKNGVQTIFIRPTTAFQRSTISLDIMVDGKKEMLEHPDANLWLYPVTELQGNAHVLALKISLCNSRKLGQVEDSLSAVAQEISAIQTALANATSPEEIASLRAELDEKQRLERRFEAERENLKNFIGNQNYIFKNS